MFTYNIESCHKLSHCRLSAVTTTPLWRRISPPRGDSEGGVNLQAPSQEVETTHHGLVVVTFEGCLLLSCNQSFSDLRVRTFSGLRVRTFSGLRVRTFSGLWVRTFSLFRASIPI